MRTWSLMMDGARRAQALQWAAVPCHNAADLDVMRVCQPTSSATGSEVEVAFYL